ncbi:MAG: transposase [Chlamydiales bacterium]|jgi:transposase
MKKLSDPVRKVNAQSVGLDVHKMVTVYCILDSNGCLVREGRFCSCREEFEAFMMEALSAGETHFSFEASRSSLWVHGLMRGHVDSEHVHVAQAKRIRAIANSNAKNDANDAWWLAYLTYEGRLPEAHVPGDEILELRIATRERRSSVRQRTMTINRLKSHLAQLGEVVPSSSIRTKKARQFLAEKASATGGARGQALRACIKELAFHDEAICQWEQVIKEISGCLPDVALIEDEIPGVGKALAATIVAEASDVRRFHSAKAFGCASGLTPSDRSTSGRVQHGGITREGSPHLRRALTQAAMGCLRVKSGSGKAVGDWIRAKQNRMGNKAKARAAGGRKLAEVIWRLFQYGECFDAGRAFGGRRATK